MPLVIPIAVLLGNDTDVDRDPISFVSWRYPSFIEEFFDGALNGTITVNQNGDLVFTPDLNVTRSGGFYYTITDNADGTAEGFVDINIIPVNDEPTAVADDGGVTPLDVPLVLRVSDLMTNDFDVDNEDGTAPPFFVGVDSVSVGTFEVVQAAGETFIVVRTSVRIHRRSHGPVSHLRCRRHSGRRLRHRHGRDQLQRRARRHCARRPADRQLARSRPFAASAPATACSAWPATTASKAGRAPTPSTVATATT